MWDQLCDVLTDLDYLQAKLGVLTREQQTAPATVFDLLRDFLATLEALPVHHPPQYLGCVCGRSAQERPP